jgi:hypothetical protein
MKRSINLVVNIVQEYMRAFYPYKIKAQFLMNTYLISTKSLRNTRTTSNLGKLYFTYNTLVLIKGETFSLIHILLILEQHL